MARIKTNPSLEADLWRRLKATCALLGTNASTVLEELIAQWLEEHEATARTDRRQGRERKGE
jgi:ParG